MNEKIIQKGFIPILILVGVFLLISTSVATTVGVIKYKDEIKSAVANISATIFNSKEELIKEQKPEEETITETEATTTNQISDEITEEELDQDNTKEIERLKTETQKANAEAERLKKEKEEIKKQEELQKQQEAQKIADEQKQKELEEKQVDEKESITNIELVNKELSQLISEIQERVNIFSQAKNGTDSFISTVRSTMNKYPDSSLIQQSGQQLINELNNFSFIASKLIAIDNSSIKTISSFFDTGDVPSSNDFTFSKSEYDNYFNQYNISDAKIDSLMETFVSNEKIVLDKKLEEAEEELLQKTKATQALTQLTIITQEINSQLAILDIQIKEKEAEIENEKNRITSMSIIEARLAQLIPQLNSLINQWNILIDKKDKISVINYKLDDYFNYGTPLSAEDRAFLLSLGISF